MKCAEDAGKLSRRQRRREQVAEEQRAARALKCVQLAAWSAGPQALAGEELAPRTPAKFCATVLADLKMMFQTFLGDLMSFLLLEVLCGFCVLQNKSTKLANRVNFIPFFVIPIR